MPNIGKWEATVSNRWASRRSGLGVPISLVYLDLGGTVVELISYEGAAIDPAPQAEHLGYQMIALEVDDMQRTTDYLQTKGVDIVWGPRVRETYSRAEICDPNGYASSFGSGSGRLGYIANGSSAASPFGRFTGPRVRCPKFLRTAPRVRGVTVAYEKIRSHFGISAKFWRRYDLGRMAEAAPSVR